MKEQLKAGQIVRLRSSQGEIQRVVVGVAGDVVLVCRQEEHDKAAREDRPPVTVGFRVSDVLD